MSVALGIQHAKRMRRITLTFAACLTPCLYASSHFRHDFWRKVNECKIRVLIFSTTVSRKFLTLRRIQRDIIVNVHRSSCKVHVFLDKFYRNFNFLARFSKDTQISNFVNIRTVGAELFDADRHT